MRLRRAAVAAVALVLPSVVFGQTSTPSNPVPVPRLINVSGVFHPADGQGGTRTQEVTLAVYADETGGAPIWQETQSVDIDPSGRYSVLLGATEADGVPVAVVASGEARWLGITWSHGGGVDQPRLRLTSVPYALRASDADTLGGRPASAYLLSPSTRNAAGGGEPTTGSSSAGPAGVLPGAAGYVAKYTNAADVGPSAIHEALGSVGIGTTAPIGPLHVRFTNTTGNFTGYTVQNLGSTATSYSGMLFYDQTGALGQFQGFNNATHEYRINNIASGGTINFMINHLSKFLVGNNGDITTATGRILKNGLRFLGDYELGNTGVGLRALNSATSGATNTAVGAGALQSLTTGGGNVAVGESALTNITNAFGNTAVGYASFAGSTGGSNIGLGSGSGQNATGSGNIFVGFGTGAGNTGGANMYFGYIAGQNLSESQTIRIGQGTYTRMFVTGVRAVTTGNADAVPVVIDSMGQLGTINSSRRFKHDIQDMGDASSRLMQLRPVTFRYAQPVADGSTPIDYGLIAEEVEAVYPDVVAHSADGQVETVQYQKINAMLLNEVQKQHRQLERQASEIDALKARLAALECRRVTPCRP
jgi:Chaperone of endosialidase